MGSIIFHGTKEIGNIKFAITRDEQRKGLMNVDWPPPLMVFPYKKASIRKFWMKDTPSPLDIIFCHANKVIYIDYGVPFNETRVGPDRPCDLVIEGPLGFAEKNGIRVGSKVRAKFARDELIKILLIKD
ncbi:MAG TPA: DUF192 domain-containing protein [Candidatus Glassbacteria bacterium]|nr:DUF192 domain-containing protein [Candidatus Glassbacteria bacterium]